VFDVWLGTGLFTQEPDLPEPPSAHTTRPQAIAEGAQHDELGLPAVPQRS
jgi:hypothetical protein